MNVSGQADAYSNNNRNACSAYANIAPVPLVAIIETDAVRSRRSCIVWKPGSETNVDNADEGFRTEPQYSELKRMRLGYSEPKRQMDGSVLRLVSSVQKKMVLAVLSVPRVRRLKQMVSD
ncbi:hypothetical protein NDU88_007546 [Pleurodeles waltl]|uniref:Uncharacterized protein n=1 Tax=Pleurodeles waltl TaxID=8319 RepID=A0AAV7QL46_PLEWA|nr:hypothetical protein NDU88_007546 [Pleurodeles waltl]